MSSSTVMRVIGGVMRDRCQPPVEQRLGDRAIRHPQPHPDPRLKACPRVGMPDRVATIGVVQRQRHAADVGYAPSRRHAPLDDQRHGGAPIADQVRPCVVGEFEFEIVGWSHWFTSFLVVSSQLSVVSVSPQFLGHMTSCHI